ncbi:MAG: hypothetical protein RSG96_05885, partial [Clostridia bacterium]
IGMLVKYVVIVLGQSLMLCSTKGSAFNAALGVAAVAQVQQIITALIGMVLAKVILLALPASVKA